jgi:sphingolipid delta-4 desaturase
MISCVFIAGGIHPCAGHFLSEHYVLQHTQSGKNIQETYSYYGGLNKFTWNVGYHNEHHDFPNIPGSRLPKVRAAASEYYDTLTTCPSWTFAIINYITCPRLGPHCRVKRYQK